MHKAGLEGVDKDKVHQVISNASKGSSYYNSEELRLKDVKIKVAMYQKKIEEVKRKPNEYARIEAASK